MNKIYTYTELKQLKEAGKTLDWKTISKEQLYQLAMIDELIDSQIADLYGVTNSQVKSKRYKFDLKHNYYSLESIQRIFLNEQCIDMFSKAITEYAFRSGPIEDMHANNQLSQEDMMALNKYMVNKIAGLLLMLSKSEWDKINKTLGFYLSLASGWDKAEPDTSDFMCY